MGCWSASIEIKKGITAHPPKSLDKLSAMVENISIDRELINLIDNPETRNELINTLLNGGYFSDNEIERLRLGIEELDTSFVYEERISQMIKDEFQMSPKQTELDGRILEPSRDPAFRRLVLEAYSETCSVCGMHLVTTSGVSVIDAAHILPHSKFKNDDVRNGLALCKTHHWLFDHGLISVDERYRTIVSKSIEREVPTKAVSGFNKREIILPGETERFPSPVALEWHRKNVWEK